MERSFIATVLSLLLFFTFSAPTFTETLGTYSSRWMWTDKEVYGRGETVSIYFQNHADFMLKTDQSWIEFWKDGTWVKIFQAFTITSDLKPGNIVGFVWTQMGNETHPHLPFENLHQVSGGIYRAMWRIRHMDGSSFATFNATFEVADKMVPDDYPTIQAAINNASSGDTIFVRAGIYRENVVLNKTLALVGEDRASTIIDGNETGVVVSVTADNASINQFTVKNGGGIYAGISLSSNGNEVANNVLNNNWCGVSFENGSGCNLIANNTMVNNLNGVSGELWSNSRIIGNILTDNLLGIWVGPYSTNNTVAFNDIRGHWSEGISIWQSSFNVIFGNNITDNNQGGNWAGITIGSSSDNTFFHNNIIDNGVQVNMEGEPTNKWDDGYPSGGNYWSDYAGVDDYRGSYQNMTGSDGIGDEEYVIREKNVDRYPLMNPWGTKPTPPPVERGAGVKAGDWIEYGVKVNYTSNDPNPPIPPPPLGAMEIESYKVEVESVSGTNITFQVVIRFNNGTETSWKMWTDVASALSRSFPTFFIAANLSAGDTVFKESYSAVINTTLTRTYAGAEREVNYFGQWGNHTSPYPSLQQVSEMHVYWDRATGILDEWIDEREYTELNQGFVTYMYTGLVVKETNVWEIEEVVKVRTKISPSLLNLRGRGMRILAFLRVPKEYSNKDVNVSSILLNGAVSPKRILRVGRHGLLVIFKRADVVDHIKAEIQPWNRRCLVAVPLTISGELHNGAIIEGMDIIWILQRCQLQTRRHIPTPLFLMPTKHLLLQNQNSQTF